MWMWLLLLCPTLVWAQQVPPSLPVPLQSPASVYRQESGIDWYFDHQGSTGRVYHLMPGLSMYFFERADGQRVTGTLWEPMPQEAPLPIPPSAPIESYLPSAR